MVYVPGSRESGSNIPGIEAHSEAELIADRQEIVTVMSAANTPDEIRAAFRKLYGDNPVDIGTAKPASDEGLLRAKQIMIENAKMDLKKWKVE